MGRIYIIRRGWVKSIRGKFGRETEYDGRSTKVYAPNELYIDSQVHNWIGKAREFLSKN